MIEFCNHNRNEEEMKFISEVGKPVVTHVTNNFSLNRRARDEELYPGFPRIHTSLTLTIRPETLGNIEFNCIFTCHLVHSVV